MLKNIGIVMVAVAFLSLVMFVGELFLIRAEIQGAFDRSTRIAAGQSVIQSSPDLPIDDALARDVFLDMLQKNLNLNSSGLASTEFQRVRNVTVSDFRVLNTTDTVAYSVMNPVTGSVINGTISEPSLLVMGIATVHIPFWPSDISLPIFSVSGGHRPA